MFFRKSAVPVSGLGFLLKRLLDLPFSRPWRSSIRRAFRTQTVPLAIALAAGSTGAFAAGPADYWAGLNKDGNGRNASDRSLQGNLCQGSLCVRWAQALPYFSLAGTCSLSPPPLGKRANNFSIRDGKILLMGYSGGDVPGYGYYSMYSLQTGARIVSYQSFDRNTGGVETGLSIGDGGYFVMDSDTKSGLEHQYWNVNGHLYAAHGGDCDSYWHFDAHNGQLEPGETEAGWFGSRLNASGYFTMTNADPLMFAIGGGAGSAPDNPGAVGVLGQGVYGTSSMKMYASHVLEGNRVYAINATNYVGTYPNYINAYGVSIQMLTVNHPEGKPVTVEPGPWYWEPNKGFLNLGWNRGGGAPRAFVLVEEDNRLYYFGYRMRTTPPYEPDWPYGLILTAVNTTTGKEDFEIRTGYDPLSEANPFLGSLNKRLLPQIAARGRYIVVFQPQQSAFVGRHQPVTNAHLFVFDTVMGTLVRTIGFPANSFQTNTSTGNDLTSATYGGPELSKEQAVQMVVAGDDAYIVEPFALNGALRVRVEKIPLVSGSPTRNVLTPRDLDSRLITVDDANKVAMRELSATDGALTALIDYGLYSQALVVLEGNVTPFVDLVPRAIISAPTTGITVFNPRVPANQYDTGIPIRFSAAGSIDPDGGTLTYSWGFGDGNTSTESNPTHSYAMAGPYDTTTPRSVTLTVRDDEANLSNPVSIQLAIRNATDPKDQPPMITEPVTATPNPAVTEMAINFRVRATDPDKADVLTYIWDFKDGTVEEGGADIQHSYDSPGTYDVQVRVYDGRGASVFSSVSLPVNLRPNQPPSVGSPIAMPNPAVPGQVVAFNVDATDPDEDPLYYEWTFGDGEIGAGSRPGHAYSSVQDFTATVTVSDGHGGSVPRSVTVRINPNQPPVISEARATPNPGYTGQTITFTASATDPEGHPITYEWDFGDGEMASGPNPTTIHIYTRVDRFPASLTVRDPYGGSDMRKFNVEILLNRPPVITSATGTPNPAYGDEGVRMEVVATDPDGDSLTYTWYQQGSEPISGPSPVNTLPPSPGPHVILVRADDGKGGFASRTVLVNIILAVSGNQPPQITAPALATPNPASVGASVRFSASASDPDGDTLTYLWDFGDGTSEFGQTPEHRYSEARQFTARVYVSDRRGGNTVSTVVVTAQ